MDDFVLIDHNHRAFTRNELRGKWHFVSYGYTFCPDICPITLSILSSLVRRLQEDAYAHDTGVLFYSVDPERDTPERLAQYVTFFNRDFIGLTYTDDRRQPHIPFEKSLGMVYEIPAVDVGVYGDEYPVNHGVMIYLLNPEGNLQAVFTPEFNDDGMFYFSTDRLYTDYRAIRSYLSH
jgi:protein SCO1